MQSPVGLWSLSAIGLCVFLSGCSPRSEDTQVRVENLGRLGKALFDYHDLHWKFPRSNGTHEDIDDGPSLGLSWRVHLLPHLGLAELYDRFDLDAPWDDPGNAKLIGEMPTVFKTPGVEQPGHTTIHVLVGPGGYVPEGVAFVDPAEENASGSIARSIRDFTDGASNTILAVEAGPSTAEPWTKPGGLRVDLAKPADALGDVGDSVLILLGDGTVRQPLMRKIDGPVLRALMTTRGQEDLDELRPAE